MIDLDQFDDDRHLETIARSLDHYLENGKDPDALESKWMLMKHIEDKEHLIKVTYLLSIIAEHFPYYFSNYDIGELLPLLEGA
jgi:hypothetical protein